MARNRKGNGSVFRPARGPRVWVFQYRHPITGKRKQHSSGLPEDATKTEAIAKLQELLVALRKGETPAIEQRGADAWTFERLARLLDEADVDKNNSAREHNLRRVRLHVRPFFGSKRLPEITTDLCKQYRKFRRDEQGAAVSTINDELGRVRRGFILAHASGYRGPRPTIELPDPKNARKGFFEYDDFVALRDALRSRYWKRLLTFGYYTGWRMKAELARMRWSDNVDVRAGVIVIFDSKNGEGRTFPVALIPELKAMLDEMDRERRAQIKAGRVPSPWVFHRDDDGRTIVSKPGATRTAKVGSYMNWVRDEWNDARRACGLASIPHDLRRTAYRNLIRAGVSLKTAMMLTGHKTTEIALRYFIVDERELRDGAARLATHSAHVAADAAAAARESQTPAA